MKLVDIDKSIAELNNLSLREVFEGGNEIENYEFDNNDITGWGAILGTIAGVDNTLEVTVSGISATSHYAHYKFDRFANNVYYSNVSIKAPYNNIFSFFDGSSFRDYGNPIPNQFTQLSIIFTQPVTRLATESVNLHRFRIDNSINYSVGDKWFLDDVYFINLTALGIANLTKAQLDNYFALYQSGVEASGFVQKTFSGDTKFALAKGIDAVAHGGKTYREIFEGGNISSIETFTINTTADTSAYLTFNNIPINNVIYMSVFQNQTMTSNQRNTFRLDYVGGSSVFESLTANYNLLKGQRSFLITSTLEVDAVAHRFVEVSPLPIVFTNYILLNLTQLFGAGNEPNKATMDTLFQQYQEGGTVQAQAFIQTAGKDTRVIDAKLPYLNMMSIREVFDANLQGTLGLTQAELDAMFALYQAGTLKLSDVFETGNLVEDWYSSPNWSIENVSFTSFQNNNLTLTGQTSRVEGYLYYEPDITVAPNNKMYFLYHWDSDTIVNTDWVFFTNSGTIIGTSITNKNYSIIQDIGNRTSITRIRFDVNNNNTTNKQTIKKPYLTNLNTHNLQATTKTFMDDLFKAYNRYKSPLFIDTNGVAYGQVFISKGD